MRGLLFLLALSLPVSAWAQTRTLTVSAPSQVYAGESFTVPTSASTNAGGGEQIGFYHGQYSTDGGASWTWFTSDFNVGTSATRHAFITAGSAGSTIIVWAKIAFRDGAAGDVDYDGNAIDWGGSWGNNGSPPAKYVYISVVAPPNQAPTVNWVQNPAAGWINDWFAVQARGHDANGNLSSISVWKEWVPFAMNGGGNGWESYSDANMASSNVATGMTFQAQSGDSSGATSGVISHTVPIYNRAASGTFTVNGSAGNSAITFGQAVAVSSSVSDPDGNISVHSFWWDQGSGLMWTHPVLTWDYPPNSSGWYNLNIGDGYNASGGSSVRGFNFQPQKAGVFNFHNVVADPYVWAGVGASVIALTVNKATPSGSFSSRTINPGGSTYTFQASDLNATFSNPYSGSVPAPAGGASYSIVAGGSGAVSTGTVVPEGTYTIRASYGGDSNYHSASVDAVFTISRLSQTISVTQPPTQTYLGMYTMSATATSGLPVSYTLVSGPANLTFGGQLNFTGVGSVVVRTSQSGNATYKPAPVVDVTIQVNQASQTMSFPNPGTQSFGTSLPLSATASSGLAVSYTLVSGPATLAGGTLSFTGVGTVRVRASQAGNANYLAATSIEQDIIVAKANQTITFATPANQTYGATLSLNATASSSLPVSYAVQSGPASVTGNAVTFTGPGSVTIRASQAGNANYNPAPTVDRTFSVGKATPAATFQNPRYRGLQTLTHYTVQAGDLDAVFLPVGNGVNPTGAIAYSIVNVSGSGASPTSGSVTTATQLTLGAYTIRASYAGDARYNATSVDVVWHIVTDADSDGVPDYLEAQLGLNPNSANHSSDESNQNELKIHRPN